MRTRAFPLLLLLLLSVAALTAAGCAGAGAPRTATVRARPAAGEGGVVPGGEAAANGEAPALLYTDARGGYHIDSAGPMTANADGTAAFLGPQERLEVAIRTGAGLDPAALATADLATLRASLAGFRLVSGPAAVQLGGQRMVKVVYVWTAGTSTVTGKPIELTTARYYVAKDATKVAVVTYGITSSQFDPQGADDVALTFGWS